MGFLKLLALIAGLLGLCALEADAQCVGGNCGQNFGFNGGGVFRSRSRQVERHTFRSGGSAGAASSGGIFRRPTQVLFDRRPERTQVIERSLLREAPLPPKAPAEAGASETTDEQTLIAGINAYRGEHNKPPLAVDPLLMQVAHERVDNLSQSNPHASPRFGSAMSHAARYANWRAVGDVVAGAKWSDGSPATATDSVKGWEQSPGHAKCMLGLMSVNDRYVDEGYDRIGVARGRLFDLAIFGRRSAATKNAQCNCLQTGVCNCGDNCKCK